MSKVIIVFISAFILGNCLNPVGFIPMAGVMMQQAWKLEQQAKIMHRQERIFRVFETRIKQAHRSGIEV